MSPALNGQVSNFIENSAVQVNIPGLVLLEVRYFAGSKPHVIVKMVGLSEPWGT